jgi:hypothetical protein
LTRWDADDLAVSLRARGLAVTVSRRVLDGELGVTEGMVRRWLEGEGSLGARIAAQGGDAAALTAGVRRLVGRTVPWRTTVALLVARPG